MAYIPWTNYTARGGTLSGTGHDEIYMGPSGHEGEDAEPALTDPQTGDLCIAHFSAAIWCWPTLGPGDVTIPGQLPDAEQRVVEMSPGWNSIGLRDSRTIHESGYLMYVYEEIFVGIFSPTFSPYTEIDYGPAFYETDNPIYPANPALTITIIRPSRNTSSPVIYTKSDEEEPLFDDFGFRYFVPNAVSLSDPSLVFTTKTCAPFREGLPFIDGNPIEGWSIRYDESHFNTDTPFAVSLTQGLYLKSVEDYATTMPSLASTATWVSHTFAFKLVLDGSGWYIGVIPG